MGCRRFLFFYVGIMVLLFMGCGSKAVYELEDTPQEDIQENGESDREDRAEDPDNTSEEKEEESFIYVHVCGAVQREGVYVLSPGSRVADALTAAGGLREDACGESLNQARQVTDGEQLRVLTLEEAARGYVTGEQPGDASGLNTQNDSDKVNINIADLQTLMTLSGIGQTKAEAIVAYRQEHGYFQQEEDLMQVSGIGEGTFEKIKDRITVN